VSSVPIAGGATTPIVPDSTSMPGPLTIDGTTVYWASQTTGTVFKAPLDGGAVTTLASGQDDVIAIAVDETSVYWLNNGNGSPGSVMKLTPK
jgi:hypothetical protein